MVMKTEEFFAEAKRLNLRMLGTPEETRAALDLKDVEITRLRELVLAYAMCCGELSKGLAAGDPIWDELRALGERIPGPTIQWPNEKAVGRAEDMGQGYLRLVLDSDNDVNVAVWDGKRSASVEFCNPGGGGGGRSSRTRMALITLMVAIEADNAERPDLQRP